MLALQHNLHTLRIVLFYSFYSFFFQILSIELRSLWMLGKHSATKRTPSLLILFFTFYLFTYVFGGVGV